MVYIAYFTESNLQICDYAQKQCICRENCKYALDENFHGHFCPPTKGCQVLPPCWGGFVNNMRPSNYPIFSLMMMMIMMNDDVVSGNHIDLGVERIESAIFRSFSRRLILAHVRGRYQPE